MIIRRVVPEAETLELQDGGARERLREWYATAGPTVQINLVTTISGTAVDPAGVSAGLTSPTDRMILGVIRSLADVVLIGARTLRAEGPLMPRSAKLAVVTSSGVLDGHGLPADLAPGRLLVFCPDAAVETVASSLGAMPAEVIPLGESPLSPAHLLAALTDRGLDRIVVEGGPMLATQFLRAELVDELCLTTSPQLGAVALPVLDGLGAPREARLSFHAVDDAGYLYSRWSLNGPNPQAMS